MFRQSGLILLFVLAAACGHPVDSTYAGDPLVTLRGQASLSATNRPDGPVRLTLAWYPGLVDDSAAQPSAPASILTEDIAFQSTFPADFALPLTQPPPEAARVAVGGRIRGRAATGFLLAYRDMNDNHRLDPLPARGGLSNRDRVVGSSWGGADSYVLLYLEEAQDADTGLKRGFNLVHITVDGGGVVQLDTPIPLALSAGSAQLDLLACEVAWDQSSESEPPCGLDFEQPPPPEGTLEVHGSVSLEGRAVTVYLYIDRDDVRLNDATVTVAGRPIPYVNDRFAYYLEETDSTLLSEGGTVELVVRWGDTVDRRLLTVPDDFSILSPGPGARVKSNTELDVDWTAARGAVAYDVTLEAPDAPELNPLTRSFTNATDATLLPVSYVGDVTLRVAAVYQAWDASHYGWLSVENVRTRPLTLVP
ncbi:hypothetical protein JY651_17945 [Pyxidicoccus parkwayensis]|uniref:Lipoprotein n=1 Tax=Pyxidicoccus parkwayensis TaxID=2813578 RepID=A0ABX7P882_9BACT|nr:hypothetical protein [Pyxidicoccus parkwaysis]QSQ26695.1 hypothetical protein JY651_17945 [Pyxidicoccus parkwaysis]